MIYSNDEKSTETFLPHRRSQIGFNEYEPSCADVEGTVEADAASLVLSEVRGTVEHAAASPEGAWVEVAKDPQVWEEKHFKMHVKKEEGYL